MFKILDVAEILRRLERAPLLLLETEPAWGGLLRDARVRGRKLVRAATIDDSSVLLDAAERDLGIAYAGMYVEELIETHEPGRTNRQRRGAGLGLGVD